MTAWYYLGIEHTLTNAEIATQLMQLAGLLRAQKANRYKVAAYRRAADSLRAYPRSVAAMAAASEDLTAIPSVGTSIAGAIAEVVRTGTLSSINSLKKDLAPGVPEIAVAAGISIRDAKRVVKELGVTSADSLREALAAGRASGLGPKLEFTLRAGLEGARRVLWDDAQVLVAQVGGFLRELTTVEAVEVTGSFRRRKDTVGTISFQVAAQAPEQVRRALSQHAGLTKLAFRGDDVIDGTMASGPRLRVRLAGRSSWGDVLVQETAAPAHLAELSEAGLLDGAHPCATEEEWFASRHLEFIPPELREGRGEVAAARQHALPRLIELSDLRGDLHCHTTASDGANSIAEMAGAAKKRGYSYIAITDHSQSLKITRGLDEGRLRQQAVEIKAFNARHTGVRVLKGSEVDILADGSLDFPDALLARLDIVMASIHSRFGLDREAQTRRLLKAVSNPYLTCLGHMTGRLLLRRPGYDIDVDRVLRAVQRHGKLLEINSSPDRLDINDELAIKARAMGIDLLINTDAHSVREFGFMPLGVQQARRGWQTKGSIVNALPLTSLLKRLRRTRASR